MISIHDVKSQGSLRFPRPRQQLRKIVVHAGHVEIRLALEWTTQVVNLMGATRHELNHSEDEIFGCIKRIENLVSADRQSRLSRCPSLYLDEAEFPSARIFAFNVVSHLLELSVHRLKAETTLDLHDDGARTRGHGQSVDAIFKIGR